MFILYGLLLAIAYWVVGWLFIEIPFSFAMATYNKRKYGAFDVKLASRDMVRLMVMIEIIVLSLICLVMGIDFTIVIVAAVARFFALSVISG